MRRADVVRELVSALDRRDYDEVFRYVHPAVVAELDFELVAQTRRISGLEQARERMAAIGDVPVRFVLDEVRDVGERVLVIVTLEGTAPDGGAFRARTGSLWSFEDDRVTHFKAYLDAADAEREAAAERVAFPAWQDRRRGV